MSSPVRRTVFFNLNFDDFHPQVDPDFGGDPDSGNFLRFRELLAEFPSLKITLFTVPNWTDRPRTLPRAWYHAKHMIGLPVISPLRGEPFRIDKHPRWCEAVRALVSAGRLEITIHGYDHCNPWNYNHGQEFSSLHESEAYERIVNAEQLLSRCQIPFVKGFRPPGWGMSAGLIQALKRLRYRFVSPFSPYLRLSRVGIFEGMAVPPQNWGLIDDPETALRLADEYGLVFAKGHIAARYGAEEMDGISDKTWESLWQVLDRLQTQFDVRFVSMSEFLSAQIDSRTVDDWVDKDLWTLRTIEQARVT